MTIQRILVQVSNYQWTLEAAHSACQVARLTAAEIVFVKMVPVQHATWLGTDFGYLNLTTRDHQALNEYAATAEDYGVTCSLQFFQYLSFVEGLAQAAALFEAQLVFAIPLSTIPALKKFQIWSLHRALINQQRQLATSDRVNELLDESNCNSPKVAMFV